jgi:hypothetical protein
MAIIPDSPETLLARSALADALTAAGFPISSTTLRQKLAVAAGRPSENSAGFRCIAGPMRWIGPAVGSARW